MQKETFLFFFFVGLLQQCDCSHTIKISHTRTDQPSILSQGACKLQAHTFLSIPLFPFTMKLVITPRSAKSRKFPITLELTGSPADVRVEDVQNAIATKYPQLYLDRQRLTVEKTALEAGKTLSDYGLKDGDSVTFKDLGKHADVFFSSPLCRRGLKSLYHYT